MSIEKIVDAIKDIITINLVAQANLTSNVTVGDTLIHVDDSFQFSRDQEIVLIDWGYNQEGSTHYQQFEYAKIKKVNNTTSITLTDPVVGNWLLSENSFIQKTIGHDPLYANNIFYGDREVIPLNEMAVTVEPVSLSNEWIYIQGGLSEEYKVQILVYGKDVKFEEGRRILDKYTDAIYQLMMNNIHLEVDNYHTPLVANYTALSNTVVIADTPENRDKITVTSASDGNLFNYQMQDNNLASCWFGVSNVAASSGTLVLTINLPQQDNYEVSDFAILKKWNFYEYIYDSRVDAATFGKTSKASAFLRVSELNWWGKKVKEHRFPQRSNRV